MVSVATPALTEAGLDTSTTLLPSLVSAVTVGMICLWLYRAYREPYLLIWAGAWGLWVVRYAYGLLVDTPYMASNEFVLPALVIGRSVLMVWGAYALSRRPLPQGWLLSFAGVALVTVGEIALGTLWTPFGIRGLHHYALFTASLIWSGVLFLRVAPSAETLMGGGALILFGLLQATFPFQPIGPESWAPAWYSAVLALQMLVGFSVLLCFNRMERMESETNARVSDALVRALGDHLPICAGCKSVRAEDGTWVSLEEHVHAATGSLLSHGLCTHCFSKEDPRGVLMAARPGD